MLIKPSEEKFQLKISWYGVLWRFRPQDIVEYDSYWL